MTKQIGLTLLETILALVIGVIIIMGVLVYYQSTSDNANRVATIKMVGDIGTAVRAYAQSPDYKSGPINLSVLQDSGLLTAADMANPWSVDPASLQVSTSGNYLGIRFSNVPAAASTVSGSSKPGGICGSLATQLSASLPLPSPGTVTMKYYGVTNTYTITTGGGVTASWKTAGGAQQSYNSSGAAMCQFQTSGDTSWGVLSVVMDLS